MIKRSYKSCQCRNTDYWADDTLGNYWTTSRGIDPVIVIQMLMSNEVRTTRFMDHQTQKIGKPNNLKDLGTKNK